MILCNFLDSILAVGDEVVGCSGIFGHTQLIYSPVFFMFMILKFCLPIWSLLVVLEPLPTGISYTEILATSHSGVSITRFYQFYVTEEKFQVFSPCRAYLVRVVVTLSVRLIESCAAMSLMTMQTSWVTLAARPEAELAVSRPIQTMLNSPQDICLTVVSCLHCTFLVTDTFFLLLRAHRPKNGTILATIGDHVNELAQLVN